ncbi:FkbM family methyltransferase [Flavisolibacter sp. BT320]|nr:FkbM family methyltransferase [Flavisolibacter longurius]
MQEIKAQHHHRNGKSLFIMIRKKLSEFKRHFRKKHRECYSQCGEDLILNRIFRDKTEGFYVDVGANNPFEQSNTQFFYKLGWSGINIDAMPGSMNVFHRVRPRDINLEVPISDSEETLQYHIFQTSFFNSFAPEPEVLNNEKLLEVKALNSTSLAKIFEKHVGSKVIDFMAVDVEGWDLNVLRSNDWNKFRPKVLIVEMLDVPADKVGDTEMAHYMDTIGYAFFCSTSTNALFFEKEFYNSYLNRCNPKLLA